MVYRTGAQMIVPLRAFSLTSAAAFLVQAVPVPADPLAAIFTYAGKLTVDVILLGGLYWMAKRLDSAVVAKDTAIAAKDIIIAAKELAKDEAIAKKDDAMVALVEKVTQAMVLSNANMEALRQALLVDGKVMPRRERG